LPSEEGRERGRSAEDDNNDDDNDIVTRKKYKKNKTTHSLDIISEKSFI